MTTITRKFSFDAGHRVLGHQGKCATFHGHTYLVEITCTSSELNMLGMVIDFSSIKDLVGKWIDENLDHTFILNEADPLYSLWKVHSTIFGPRKPFIMPYKWNPTAERIAEVIFFHAQKLLKEALIDLVKVRVWETPNCFAEYEPDNKK